LGRRRRYYKHIYFESKAPGRDSVFQAVKDIGRTGVNTRKEFVRLILSQLADIIDYKTKDHHGRTIKWTIKLWNGRMGVLRLINKKKKFKMSKLLRFVNRIGKAYLKNKIGPVHHRFKNLVFGNDKILA